MIVNKAGMLATALALFSCVSVAHAEKSYLLNGLDSKVGFSDSGAPDTLTQVAAVAHHPKSIRIGVAVTPVYTRTPAVIAASVTVLSQVLPGRFVMGIGSSRQTIMGQWNGIALDNPLVVAPSDPTLPISARSHATNVTAHIRRLLANCRALVPWVSSCRELDIALDNEPDLIYLFAQVDRHGALVLGKDAEHREA